MITCSSCPYITDHTQCSIWRRVQWQAAKYYSLIIPSTKEVSSHGDISALDILGLTDGVGGLGGQSELLSQLHVHVAQYGSSTLHIIVCMYMYIKLSHSNSCPASTAAYDRFCALDLSLWLRNQMVFVVCVRVLPFWTVVPSIEEHHSRAVHVYIYTQTCTFILMVTHGRYSMVAT